MKLWSKNRNHHSGYAAVLLSVIMAVMMVLAGCGIGEGSYGEPGETISEDSWYSDKDQVALYLHQYGRLPDNYISKGKAQELGWDSQKGNLWDVAPGMSIGGGRFGNREGLLPEKEGRIYYECDIDYDGGYRGAKRIVYSNDGLIYYTEDHYENFELLYPEDGI